MRKLVLPTLLICFAGCCAGQMNPQYDSYATYSSDSNNNFYQTIVVEGTTYGSCNTTCCQSLPYPPYYSCWSCPIPGCSTAVHTPKINNVINGVGGWTTGPSVSPFSYMSYQTTTSIQIPPGGQISVSGEGDVFCTVVGQMFGAGTPIQHKYPKNPLPLPCRITSWFDATRTTGPHHADDVVLDSNGHVPLGTPVYAMEDGTVTEAISGQPSAPYPACKSTVPRPPGNHVVIKADIDHYTTLYFHMTPTVARGVHVNAGDQIGTLDSSGCQSGPHLHVGRKDPNGASVNFTIPCVNPLPTGHPFDDGTIDDNDPE